MLEELLCIIKPTLHNPAKLEGDCRAWGPVSQELAIEPTIPDGQPGHALSATRFHDRPMESDLRVSVSPRLVTTNGTQSQADRCEPGVILDKAISETIHTSNKPSSLRPVDELQSYAAESQDCKNKALSKPLRADTTSSRPRDMERKSPLNDH